MDVLQPIKGAIVDFQWAFRMRGSGSGEPDGNFIPTTSRSAERCP
jgi:hypothetical protein